jgi:spore coat polysaccharide biosynthesis predicted glycosyltransferase SpsG
MVHPVRLVATAGTEDGRGHVNRVLALAEALAELDVAAELQLLRGSLSPGENDRAAAARLTLLSDPGAQPDGVVVVDLPETGHVRDGIPAERLVVFDDRNLFAGRAAIVIQPSQEQWTGPGEADRVLAGPAFVPIAASYRRLRSEGDPPRPAGEPLRVVACFGGSDPARVGARLAPALRPGSHWRAEIVLGASYVGPTADWPVAVVRDPPDLPDRLAAAELVLLGAGTMKFEAACLGRAAILVAVADDQLVVGPTFAGTGAAIYLGDGRTIPAGRVRAAIEELLADRERRTALGRRAAEVVDGRGAERLAEAIARIAVADP